MRLAGEIALALLVACSGAPQAEAQSSPSAATASALATAADLTRERKLVDESNAACKASDYAVARTKAEESVTLLLARPESQQDAAWVALLDSAGGAAWNAQDVPTAKSAWERVYELRVSTLPDDHPDLQKVRSNLAVTIDALGDLTGARALQERVLEIFSRTLPDDHPDLQLARNNLAKTILSLGDEAGAYALMEEVLEVLSRTLPDDHPDLQRARRNFASRLRARGDLAGARALQEKVLEVYSRTLPDQHPYMQAARQGLAGTILQLGDVSGARALYEKVLEVRSRTLPDDHPDLQMARANLAAAIRMLGDLAGARSLQEIGLESLSRTLPDDHPDLQLARGNLAVTMHELGDLTGARALQEKVLEVSSRTLPDDHPDLQKARGNLATTISLLGDLQGARTLQEKVVEVCSRTLPDDHPDLQWARHNLAVMIRALGDRAAARALTEKVLEVRSRTLPDDHPELQKARESLAATISELGDLVGARALQEKVLEVYSRTLSDDHPDLQSVRESLAVTIHLLGDLAGARALFEKVHEVLSRRLPDEHPGLQSARLHLAVANHELGDMARARALEEKVLEIRSRTLPDEHPDLQMARHCLVETIAAQVARVGHPQWGEVERSCVGEEGRERCAELIGALCRAQVRAALAVILASPPREAEERCSALAEKLDISLSVARGYGVFEPVHELERLVFLLAEMTRGAALASAALTRRAVDSPKYAELKGALRAASAEIAGLSQQGGSSAEFDRVRLKRESVERELVALARELSGGKERGVEFDAASLAARLGERDAAVGFRRFRETRLEVSGDLDSTGQPALRAVPTDDLWAFVLRCSKTGTTGGAQSHSTPAMALALVPLGPIEPIQAAARAWRETIGAGLEPGLAVGAGLERGLAIGVGLERGLAIGGGELDPSRERGVELRRLVFDPLIPALGDAERIVVALDDALHLVPLDALPLTETEAATGPGGDPSKRLVGDRWRIETRATLTELLIDSPAPTGTALVTLGGASFNLPAAALSNEEVASFEARARLEEIAGVDLADTGGKAGPVETVAPVGEIVALEDGASLAESPPTEVATRLRGTAWERGFTPLTHTSDEARGIGALYEEVYAGDRPVMVLEKRNASRAALESVAPHARFVHIATHGWFAPESIPSWADPDPMDAKSGLGARMSGAEQVKGMSPMLLCGLALAGANLPEDAVGRVPGLVTADELSTLDLSNCELVVLSACDTNVGERRAGQGVASLQKALQMAGARSVITSLWKVPDEATKDLMLDFYRRLWVEKQPKWKALWDAKAKLRAAKDERGNPRYTTRDWAGWVLTGDPD